MPRLFLHALFTAAMLGFLFSEKRSLLEQGSFAALVGLLVFAYSTVISHR